VFQGSALQQGTFAHDAQIEDQRLDLYSLEIEHWWQIFPLLWTLPRGQQGLLSWVRTLKGKEIQIQTRKPHSIFQQP
jgi:diacylglycerol kinase family enzyme